MVDVKTLRWPDDEDRRARLQEAGQPRLLVVAEHQPPPAVSDPLEDWVRPSATEADRRARMETLRRRAGSDSGLPTIDTDGIVRTDQGWVAVPPVEARLAELLIENFGSVVSRDALGDIAWPDGPVQRNALDVRILRLRRRVNDIGLVIRTIRSRGYLLEHA